MLVEEFKYSEITSKVIGSAIEVHKILGCGFQEVVYQRALSLELYSRNVDHMREVEMPIYYKEQRIGTRRVDFLVEGVVSVEIKAVTELNDIHLAQALNYLEAYNIEVGLLINFGEKRINVKRIVNHKVWERD